jgi:hypothetical protein
MPETWARVVELLQLPFMQRALLGGILTGVTGGLLGSFVIFRQLAFFSDALGHSALLGIVVGVALGLNPYGSADGVWGGVCPGRDLYPGTHPAFAGYGAKHHLLFLPGPSHPRLELDPWLPRQPQPTALRGYLGHWPASFVDERPAPVAGPRVHRPDLACPDAAYPWTSRWRGREGWKWAGSG